MKRSILLGGLAYLSASAAFAQDGAGPQELLPPDLARPEQVEAPVQPEAPQAATAQPAAAGLAETGPVVQPLPEQKPLVQQWPLADAKALLAAIEGIGAEGLTPADYAPQALREAIAAGAGPALDAAASTSFVWLVEDLRDGRTPMEARRQWFVEDPDAERMPTAELMAEALDAHDVAGVLASLDPTHPDYARLKQELAVTPASDKARRTMIRANMDRWRWLPRDLGEQYLITNVPEMELRFTVGDKIVRSYRTIVGKPGKTATPQLAETVEGVIFNPTWTVPQSIVKGEGLGARLLANPAAARAKGYKVSKGADGYISVVQQPGPTNSLGLMKLDMPNPHAIFLHDTPNRNLFNQDKRALSHGCVRVENAQTLAMTLAIVGNMKSKADIPELQQEAQQAAASGQYTRVAITKQLPVYITYFTMAQDVNGQLTTFADLYDRDAPVLASFDQPRQMNRAQHTDEEVVEIVDDLQT